MCLYCPQALSLQGLHGDAIAELHSALSMHPTDSALVTQVTHTTLFLLQCFLCCITLLDNDKEEFTTGDI